MKIFDKERAPDLEMPEADFSPELAIRLKRIVDAQCQNVPHDIGITLAQEVTRFYREPGKE